MIRRHFTPLFALTVALGLSACSQEQEAASPPNIILILQDDAGYGDFGITGASTPTPNIDKLATEGLHFTAWHVPTPVCSSSRASLLTGRHADRFSFPAVVFNRDPSGLPASELTMAEMLRGAGYSTHIFGKWHLGHFDGALPADHGFDEFSGIPYSNDMWPWRLKPDQQDTQADDAWEWKPAKRRQPLPLLEGNAVANPSLTPGDQKTLTRHFTDRAIDVIGRSGEKPFFIYLPYPQVHIPLYVESENIGVSGGGLYRDVITEQDMALGRIMEALETRGIADSTLVIFTSDNGPWTEFGDHGGSTGGFAGHKHNIKNGGVRVFAAMRWPDGLPVRTIDTPVSSLDLMPTFAEITGQSTAGTTLDGRSLMPLAQGQKPAERPLFFTFRGDLQAVRLGRWKLQLPHDLKGVIRQGNGGYKGETDMIPVPLALYDVVADPGETTNLAIDHPEVVARLHATADTFWKELQATAIPAATYESEVFPVSGAENR